MPLTCLTIINNNEISLGHIHKLDINILNCLIVILASTQIHVVHVWVVKPLFIKKKLSR
jgi:hypothetical protein